MAEHGPSRESTRPKPSEVDRERGPRPRVFVGSMLQLFEPRAGASAGRDEFGGEGFGFAAAIFPEVGVALGEAAEFFEGAAANHHGAGSGTPIAQVRADSGWV